MQPLYEYVCHMKGHRNSKGELAEWVIKSHETGKILSSHKSEQKAKEHLQQMHIFNEAAESAGYPKLYHICGYMTGLDDDDIRSILTTGLRIHDNGESNCIWFSTGKPFINDILQAQLVVSLECTPENIKKYRIDEFGVQNQSSAINVRENVPMEDLNIEQLMWGRIHKGEGTRVTPLTFTKYYGDFERWQRFDKDLQAVIYEDLFNMWARDDIARQGFNPDLNRLKEIMGDRLTITNFMEKKSDKLLGESSDGNNMDKRIKIFMEGVSQLGLSKNQVDAIGKITNVCMEGVDMDGFGDVGNDETQEPQDGPDSTDNFVIDAFYRAVAKLLGKYPNRLYEDETAGVIGDKITGKKFSIDFDPMLQIEVRSKDDRKTYPLWFNKSKSMDALIELIMDIFSEELGSPDNHTTGGDSAVDEEQPEF